MGRLHHLKETFIASIEQNRDYPNVEFVLLDYNSADGLRDWARDTLTPYIEAGIVTYYRTTQPKCFHHSHSRNLSLRLATGVIVCNLDADNRAGEDFAFYANERVTEKRFLRALHREGKDSGVAGRTAMLRERVLEVGGYDEGYRGWGYEDTDLYARLERHGVAFDDIDDAYLWFISHEWEERTENLDWWGKIFRFGTHNARRYRRNNRRRMLSANPKGLGKATVYRNFDESNPVVLD
jgi:glycosyltransferase involved in cell wall biosynthesis